MILTVFVIFIKITLSLSLVFSLLKKNNFPPDAHSPQTEEITVDEPKNGSHLVPLTLVREKGTYGTVTVHYEVRALRT